MTQRVGLAATIALTIRSMTRSFFFLPPVFLPFALRATATADRRNVFRRLRFRAAMVGSPVSSGGIAECLARAETSACSKEVLYTTTTGAAARAVVSRQRRHHGKRG